MNVVVALEQRFQMLPDGSIWTASGFRNAFWDRYLDVFDSVVVLARAEGVERVDQEAVRVGGDRIRVEALPSYVGPRGYLLQRREIRQRVERTLGPDDAVIARLPGPIGATLIEAARDSGRPFGAEIVGDPFDVFAPGAIRHPLRPVFRRYFTRLLKSQARQADALAYVSDGVLRKRYPARADTFTTSYSSVLLDEDAYLRLPRTKSSFTEPFHCTIVGSLEQPYKAVDVLLRALRELRDSGMDVLLTVVGEGRYKAELEALADQLGIAEFVSFTGFIGDRQRMVAILDETDLFVLPSRTEGLPRAMIEAMARGVPCVGTTVGGIPELLRDEEMVPPGDHPIALARLMRAVLGDPQRMEQMSARNLGVSRGYQVDILSQRRRDFCATVRDRTVEWVRTGGDS